MTEHISYHYVHFRLQNIVICNFFTFDNRQIIISQYVYNYDFNDLYEIDVIDKYYKEQYSIHLFTCIFVDIYMF